MLNNLLLNMYFTVQSDLAAFAENHPVLLGAKGSGQGVNFETLLGDLTDSGKHLGGLLLTLVGVIALIIGGVRLVGNFTSKQGPQTSWFTVIGLIVIGGIMLVGGFGMLELFGSSAYYTLNNAAK